MGLPVFFYRVIIDPLLRSVRREIGKQIPAGSSVIDIAFGTGALLFSLARTCSRLAGIDSDERMVQFAARRGRRFGLSHAEFYQDDAADLSRFREKEFDFAVLSMAVHQFAPESVEKIIAEAGRIASELIIADFSIPRPKTVLGRISVMVERLAGQEHFSNYLHYAAGNGLHGIIGTYNVHPLSDKTTSAKVFHVVRLTKG